MRASARLTLFVYFRALFFAAFMTLVAPHATSAATSATTSATRTTLPPAPSAATVLLPTDPKPDSGFVIPIDGRARAATLLVQLRALEQRYRGLLANAKNIKTAAAPRAGGAAAGTNPSSGGTAATAAALERLAEPTPEVFRKQHAFELMAIERPSSVTAWVNLARDLGAARELDNALGAAWQALQIATKPESTALAL